MGIATPPLPSVTSHSKGHNSLLSISMSQDYHQGIFSFSNGFERSQQDSQQQQQSQQQQHIAQQIRRDKLRVQGFDPPPPLVGIEEEESSGLPVYETAGMLSEMFNFNPSGGGATATELLENQILQSYRNPRAAQPTSGGSSAADWFSHRQGMVMGGGLEDSKNQTVVNDTVNPHHHHQHHQISSINADSAAAMQLFLMNPQHQRSPSPSPSHPPPPPQSTSSTLHMLLPNPSSSSTLQALSGGGFGQLTWLPNSGNHENNPNEIPGVVEGQGLSLSLSSSLQHLEAAKAEELRMGEGGMLFFGQGGGGSTPPQYQLKNLGGAGGALHLQGGVSHNHQLHVGLGSSFGTVNMLRNSKYAKAAQELLEEFCSVGRGQFKKNKFGRQNNNNNNGNPSSNPTGAATSGSAAAGGNSSSSSKDVPPLSASDRLEHQRRKVKLLSMLDEVDRRYNHYCDQMQTVVNSFDMVMGFGAAVPYTSLAQKAMSRHFRCLKDAIAAQLKHSCELLGEKDAGTSGVTKGETPRLKMLEQSLRQQRAFHQMGMMEQEAWRPQRGLPERSVNILRAWLFEHFLHPYPSDADKHLLARQTGLSRNQVSNWFINARVRLWKPMVEDMYQQEAKEDTTLDPDHRDQTAAAAAQTPTSNPATTATTTCTTAITPPPAPKRSEINAPENDPSFIAINTQCFSDNHPNNSNVSAAPASSSAAAQPFPAMHEPNHTTNADIESTLIRFGTSSGDVSLTLGLRHAGNLPEKSQFSVRDFGGC
ncbi:Transcription factor MEIS1 [Handroanthus impetiginosus]|uniref:Transcription factor MEIS1 n=1 Tax=Handroanthus impetiginosus TaxID=429701 RepID=A0A2G9HVH1_9LAMI|nr:Transcription factor MEIS1 [Handroanthus impetiginosus]